MNNLIAIFLATILLLLGYWLKVFFFFINTYYNVILVLVRIIYSKYYIIMMFSYFKITYTESLKTLSPTVLKNIDPSSFSVIE